MPIPILMPALSPTMTEGTLLKWHKKEGDMVKAGDLVAEIETDKATMEIEAVDEGTLGKILIAEKTEGVKVNTPIALLLEKGESSSSLESYQVSSSTIAPSTPADQPLENTSPPAQEMSASPNLGVGERVFASPLAKRIAQANNINLQEIVGSGPRGRIIKKDVDNLEKAPASGAGVFSRTRGTPQGPLFKDAPVGSMRKVIAKRLLESKQTIPHFYLTTDFQLDTLLALRKSVNDNVEGVKITVNDFIIRACALGLRDVPAARASWMGDTIRYYTYADIAVAVALEDGLITPIIKQADLKSIFEISSEMKELAKKAKDNKLKPEEFQGGCVSVSNLGMYNIPQFSAIVNPPQAGILAVGAGQSRPIIQNGRVEIATVMTCTLSVDHRVIDGKVAADLLNAVKKYIENPALMLI